MAKWQRSRGRVAQVARRTGWKRSVGTNAIVHGWERPREQVDGRNNMETIASENIVDMLLTSTSRIVKKWQTCKPLRLLKICRFFQFIDIDL